MLKSIIGTYDEPLLYWLLETIEIILCKINNDPHLFLLQKSDLQTTSNVYFQMSTSNVYFQMWQSAFKSLDRFGTARRGSTSI